jgi:hypothetical protein
MRYTESFDFFEDRVVQQMRAMQDSELHGVARKLLNIAKRSGLERREIKRMLGA